MIYGALLVHRLFDIRLPLLVVCASKFRAEWKSFTEVSTEATHSIVFCSHNQLEDNPNLSKELLGNKAARDKSLTIQPETSPPQA